VWQPKETHIVLAPALHWRKAMFGDLRSRRTLQRTLNHAKAQLETDYRGGERDIEKLFELQRKINFRESLLLKHDSEQLIKKAQKYGIELPLTASWWADDSVSGLPPEDVTRWLTQTGLAGGDGFDNREKKQKLGILDQGITALTGLGGTIIGIISALKR
jgi:hypothetical protein